MASTEQSASPETTETPTKDVNLWPTYTSTLFDFSLKYPRGWYAKTTEPEAEVLAFSENKESLESTLTGFKIEIVFQVDNGKTLKDWVEANSVSTGESKKAKEITISEKTAYQQELVKNDPKVATYIAIPSEQKVMVVTYSAPADKFGEGGEWYNNLINSIKLE